MNFKKAFIIAVLTVSGMYADNVKPLRPEQHFLIGPRRVASLVLAAVNNQLKEVRQADLEDVRQTDRPNLASYPDYEDPTIVYWNNWEVVSAVLCAVEHNLTQLRENMERNHTLADKYGHTSPYNLHRNSQETMKRYEKFEEEKKQK